MSPPVSLVVNDRKLVSFELPAIFSSKDAAVAALGGSDNIRNVTDGSEPCALFRFKPAAIFEHPLSAEPRKVQSILLRRKRANKDDDWTYECIGRIETVYRFMGMADFQYSTQDSPFVNYFDNTIGKLKYESIVDFNIEHDAAKGKNTDDLDIPPPPIFSTVQIPSLYNFKQKRQTQQIVDGDKVYTVSRSSYAKPHTLFIQATDLNIPQSGSDQLVQPPPQELADLVKALGDLFEERPMWTRRALLSKVGPEKVYLLKYAISYVAFGWATGPFKDSYNKFAFDPRHHPQTWVYQTLTIQNKDLRTKIAAEVGKCPRLDDMPEKQVNRPLRAGKIWSSSGHIFDGKNFDINVRTFQICDVTDPQLESFLRSAPRRRKFHVRSGWFTAERLIKARAVMRCKQYNSADGLAFTEAQFESLIKGEEPSVEDFEDMATFDKETIERLADKQMENLREQGVEVGESANDEEEEEDGFDGVFGSSGSESNPED